MKRVLFFALGIGICSILYFFWPQKPHYGASFAVSFLPEDGLPLLDVEIDEKNYPLVFDLGAAGMFSLQPSIVSSLEKERLYSHTCVDVQGNSYPSTAYRVPKVRIHGMTFSEVVVWEEEEDFLEKGSTIYREDPEKPLSTRYGRIGRDAFIGTKANILLDFASEKMYVACHLEDLRKKGYEKKDFFSVPLEIDPEIGVILTAKIDIGEKRFLLDTGATRSILQPFHVDPSLRREWKGGIFLYESSKLLVEGHNLGEWNFLLYPTTGPFAKVDGFLGMDFFRERAIYLDFSHKIGYITKNRSQKEKGSEEETAPSHSRQESAPGPSGIFP